MEGKKEYAMIKIICMGAAGTVTGSNYLIEDSRGKKILVDCGLFQGGKQTEWRNSADWGFDPSEIDTLLLTHAHIDHSGRIPKLVQDGFHGKIVTSPPTVELCEIMLLDSGHVQEMEAEWQTRKNRRKSKKGIQPLYTVEDAQTSLQYFSPVERDQIIDIGPGVKARFRNAGHILGSSIIEMWIEDAGAETKIVFSGDIGKNRQLIVKDPFEIPDADYLFIESTYGNRLHRSFEDSKAELLDAIRYAVSNNEKTIIPAFAVERTQEIIYLLGEFYRDGSLPDIPIYLDSPLAIKATEIFRKNKKYYDEEAIAIVDQGFDPFDMPNLKFTPSTEESMEINKRPGPAIVMAGSGMCTAGRIKHHLKHNLWRSGASIVIVGFQAMGTTGRRIVDGEKQVRIFRENVAVAAKVSTIGGFSAHADQKGLLEWAGHFAGSHPRVFVTHGEPTASEALAAKLKKELNLEAYVPRMRESLILEPQKVTHAMFPEAEPEDLQKVMGATVISLEKELEELKKRLAGRSGRVQEADIDRLKEIEEDMRMVLPG
ncbi:MAG: MBL fold metallo-hydrolase [Thermodesulfobacteriota bacterium]|nr:MBL fold metallo-hydrolase [Thermodesulfobacteriota bacterium]